MPIPEFDPATSALPAGIHEATWPEVAARFGINAARLRLLSGLRVALGILAAAGCTRVYLGGSFVAAKALPADWDGCYGPEGVDPEQLPDSILHEDRDGMKDVFGGEIYIQYDQDVDYLAFFQTNRRKQPVGLIALDPRTAKQEEK